MADPQHPIPRGNLNAAYAQAGRDTAQRLLGDPSDKVADKVADTTTDAAADGQFQQVNRRAGYGDDLTKIKRILHHAAEGHTLAAGEGRLLVDYFVGQCLVVEKERAAWQRRFNAIRGHDTFIEKRGDRWPYLWTEPATEYRAMDVCVGAFYGNSPEEAADALADFWEQYERDSAATPVDAAPRDGGSDEPTPF